MRRRTPASLIRSAAVAAAGLLGVALAGPAAAAPAAPTVPAPVERAQAAPTTAPVTHAQNDRVPQGAVWTQHYFPSADRSGAELHADVLLPEDLTAGETVPVILSVGPYFSHYGELAPVEQRTGPSSRFTDLVEGADLFDRGYAFVMVDSRGFGGSTGCLDFAGPREQADVKAAIAWAAAQPWSTGAVGMYGKSADATTGLLGNNLDQDALKAVVAQEPIWDLHRNTYSGGVPRTTLVNVPTSYNAIAQIPGMDDDDARYQENAAYEVANPQCLSRNLAGYTIADPEARFWRDRDMAARAQGSDTPLLFTQGFLEWNTEAEGMDEFLAGHQGPQRGWLGQWDHVRGNDRFEDGRPKMGREGWFAEVMSFYDEYLKGVEPSTRYPNFAVQDSTGEWRGQDTWPVVERTARVGLGRGTYVDDGRAAKAGRNAYVVRSAPVKEATRITGTPSVSLTAQGRGNVMVRLHDVAPDGTAVMFDEQVSVIQMRGTTIDLKSTDWTLKAGHALAVEIGTVQPEGEDLPAAFGPGRDWVDAPSKQRVRVTAARLDLALDSPSDDRPTQGSPAPYLEVYRDVRTSGLPGGRATFTLPNPAR
ncbi:MAG: CocE/NonD family hydrolase [Dermatophilaceae bacterium]